MCWLSYYHWELEGGGAGSVWVGILSAFYYLHNKHESALTLESLWPEAADLHCPLFCSMERKDGTALDQGKVLFEFRELCSVALTEPWKNTVRGKRQLPICKRETVQWERENLYSRDWTTVLVSTTLLPSKGFRQHHYLLSLHPPSGNTIRVVNWLECNQKVERMWKSCFRMDLYLYLLKGH